MQDNKLDLSEYGTVLMSHGFSVAWSPATPDALRVDFDSTGVSMEFREFAHLEDFIKSLSSALECAKQLRQEQGL